MKVTGTKVFKLLYNIVLMFHAVFIGYQLRHLKTLDSNYLGLTLTSLIAMTGILLAIKEQK